MVEYIKKYGSKLSIEEMHKAADRYSLNEADKFVIKRHPKNKDAILLGPFFGESREPEALFYENEKTGEIFSEPEYYYEIIKNDTDRIK